MHAFDRQTDRQTDGNPIAIPRLHSMQRGKNEHLSSANVMDGNLFLKERIQRIKITHSRNYYALIRQLANYKIHISIQP